MLVYQRVCYMATAEQSALGLAGCPIPVLVRCVAAMRSWATSMARESVTGYVTRGSEGEVSMIDQRQRERERELYIYIHVCIDR